MSELTGDLRLLIEQQIDEYIKDPNALTSTKETLTDMGIRPNLETTLSFITGTVEGVAVGMWLFKRKTEGKAPPSNTEINTFLKDVKELLTRRAMELRQHFVKEEYM